MGFRTSSSTAFEGASNYYASRVKVSDKIQREDGSITIAERVWHDVTDGEPSAVLPTFKKKTRPLLPFVLATPRGAQEHPYRKREAIGKILRRYDVNDANWTLECNVRPGVHSAGSLDIPREHITIAVSGPSVYTGKLPDLLRELGKHIWPYLGTLVFSDSGEAWDLESQYEREATSSSRNKISNRRHGTVAKNVFNVDVPARRAGRSPVVQLHAINFLDNRDPSSRFTISAAFKVRNHGGKYEISFSGLEFEGPSSHSLQGVNLHFALNAECRFSDVCPRAQFIEDPEAHPRDRRSATYAWRIDHAEGFNSQTIRYWHDLSPEFNPGLAFVESIRPSLKFRCSSRSQRTAIAIQLEFIWAAKEKGRLGSSSRTQQKTAGGYDQHAEEPGIVHSAKVVVQLDTPGITTEEVAGEGATLVPFRME